MELYFLVFLFCVAFGIEMIMGVGMLGRIIWGYNPKLDERIV